MNEDIAPVKSARGMFVWVDAMPVGDRAMGGTESASAWITGDQHGAWHNREVLTFKQQGKDWMIASIQRQYTAQMPAP